MLSLHFKILSTNLVLDKTLILFCVDTIDWYFAGGTCEYIRTQNFEDSNVLNLIKDTIERKLNK